MERKLSSETLSFIKLVSINIDVTLIENVIMLLEREDLVFSRFMRKARLMADHPVNKGMKDKECGATNDKLKKSCRFIKKMHMTIAHFSQISQLEMRSQYGSLEGRQ